MLNYFCTTVHFWKCLTLLWLGPLVISQQCMAPFYCILFVCFIRSEQHYKTHNCPQRPKLQRKRSIFLVLCSKLVKTNCKRNLISTVRTSISPSNSDVSSRVILKGAVLSRLEPFWGDLRFLFGDVFSDMSSVSLFSSRYLEFWS